MIAAGTLGSYTAATAGPGPGPWAPKPKPDMAQILLLEDEEQVRVAVAALLRVAGHEVVTAIDGAEGLEMFQLRPFDLVITDVLMPIKSGPETIVALRRLRPGLKIIATYGGGRIAGDEYPPTAESLGADRLLAKPFSLTELRAAVSEVLKAAPAQPDRP